MSDFRLALRMLRKTPFVTAIAVVSLALGIGANTAIYSIFDKVLLTPLPVRNTASLVNLVAPGPKPGITSTNQAGDTEHVFSYAMFRDLERLQTVFTGLAAHRLVGANVAARGQTLSTDAVQVSGSYFPTLGVQPALGRLLTPADDDTPGAHPVVVLSHGFWTSHFGADPAILNESIVMNGTALTVVGVAARGFEGTTSGTRPDLFVPLSMREVLSPGWKGFENRRNYFAYVFGRLEPGVSRDQAAAALAPIYRSILTDVEAPLQTGMSDATMARFKSKPLQVVPGWRGQSNVQDGARAPLLMLLAVTAIVLLTACANVANLLLARSAARAGEMAVRLSIGAGRGQLLTQLLVESCTLALAGGLAGLLVARWTLALIGSFLPTFASGVLPDTLEPRVLVFALGVSMVTGVVFGLYPALHSTRPDLASVLKHQAGQPGGSRGAARFRTALAGTQVALSMALLVAAGLFIKSLYHLTRVDLGLDTTQLVTFTVSPELNGYSPTQSIAFFGRVEDAVTTLPGVATVSASTVPLISGSNWSSSLAVQGFDAGPDTNTSASFAFIGPDFFKTLGVPLLQGREFTVGDVADRPRVAIVNQAFVRKFNLGDHAIGSRLSTKGPGTELDIEIVGLVQDAKYSEVKQAIPAQFFQPYRQDDRAGFLTYYVRASGDAAALLSSVQAAVRTLDPNLPVESPKTMAQQVRENIFVERMISTLSALFAGLATLLAAVGLYGVLAYTVAQRTREFGLRMALGADPGMVRGLVLRQVAWLTLAGAVVGLAMAVALGRGAQSLLFQMQGWDPTVLVTSTVLLTLVAFGAGLVPALRASRVAPMVALRED